MSANRSAMPTDAASGVCTRSACARRRASSWCSTTWWAARACSSASRSPSSAAKSLSSSASIVPRVTSCRGTACNFPTTARRAARGARPSWSASAQGLEKSAEHLRRRRGDVAGLEKGLLALQVADQASGFEYQQRARRHVPGRKAELPERIELAAGDVGEVERRGARAAYAGAGPHHRLELARIKIEARHFLERKAGADERITETRQGGNADTAVVEEGAAALGRCEKLVARRVVDHRMRERAAMPDADRHAVLRKAMDEVGRAVERIDDPHVLRVGVRRARLLGEQPVIRVRLAHDLDDRFLRRVIHLRDEVLGALRRDAQPSAVQRRAVDDRARAARRAHGDIEYWMHRNSSGTEPELIRGRVFYSHATDPHRALPSEPSGKHRRRGARHEGDGTRRPA